MADRKRRLRLKSKKKDSRDLCTDTPTDQSKLADERPGEVDLAKGVPFGSKTTIVNHSKTSHRLSGRTVCVPVSLAASSASVSAGHKNQPDSADKTCIDSNTTGSITKNAVVLNFLSKHRCSNSDNKTCVEERGSLNLRGLVFHDWQNIPDLPTQNLEHKSSPEKDEVMRKDNFAEHISGYNFAWSALPKPCTHCLKRRRITHDGFSWHIPSKASRELPPENSKSVDTRTISPLGSREHDDCIAQQVTIEKETTLYNPLPTRKTRGKMDGVNRDIDEEHIPSKSSESEEQEPSPRDPEVINCDRPVIPQCCPLCGTMFTVGSSQMDVDGHIAACLAASADDITW